MKINVSSKTVSVWISFLVFLAIGILAVSLIGRGTAEDGISFEVYSDVEYSEHEGWTDISQVSDSEEKSEDVSSEQQVVLDTNEISALVNSKYNCVGNKTDLQFTDEMGIRIDKISFLDGFTPENVSYSLGYVFVGDKVYDSAGTDITSLIEGYAFVGGRDENGKTLFKKADEYYYIENGILHKSENINNIIAGPAYSSGFDENYPLFFEDGYWGAKNNEGKTIVKATFTYGYGFNEGVGCFATKTKKLYFYNTLGKVISSEFVSPENGVGAFRIQNGITLVSNGKKNLIMKSSGALLDTPNDYEVLGCSDGMVLLQKNGSMGFVNSNGEWAVDPVYVNASYYSEGLSVVVDNGCLVIDRNGNVVIPKGFDHISGFSDGSCLLYSAKNGWYIAQKKFVK